MVVKLEAHHSESTNKWEAESWNISHGDITTKSPVSNFSIERHNDGRLSMSIGLDSEHFRGDRQDLHERVSGLMEAAGVEGVEFKTSSHPRLSSVRIATAEAGDLTRMAGALSSDADLGKGSTAYSIIEKNLAVQIADIEGEALGEPSGFSIDRTDIEGHQHTYFGANIDIPGALVERIEQDGSSAEFEGNIISLERTNIYFGKENASQVTKVIKQAGLEFEKGEGVIRLDQPISKVAEVLTNAVLLPKAANSEIQREFADLRPEFFLAAKQAGEDMKAVQRYVPAQVPA